MAKWRKFSHILPGFFRNLEYASLQLEKEAYEEGYEAFKRLNMLMAPGSSLDGARPNASVKDTKEIYR